MLKRSFLLVILVLVGCTKTKVESSKDLSRDVVQTLKDEEVILEYNGGAITAKEVNATIRPQLEQMRQQILNAYVKAAEDVFAKKMAAEKGATKDEVTDAELQNYMKANNLSKADAEKVRTFLLEEKRRINKQVLVMQLSKDLNVKNRLTSIRYDVGVTAAMPQMGKDTAPVTVQIFCDFGNPTCNRSRLAMVQLQTELGENLRWIFRQFPVASSPAGTEAALVSICAHKQNKFWPVHDRFFDQQANLTKDNLVSEAVAAGCDKEALTAWLQSTATQAELDQEISAAQMLGISSTPVYFVNGVRVTDVDQLFMEARKVTGPRAVAKDAE